jgi:hypothetical protein
MAKRFDTANLDNSMTYAQAPKHLKCLYYAFANAEGLSPDAVHDLNVRLMTDAVWDDSYMAAKLAHRYGYRIHPALLTFDQVKERFTNPKEKLIVLHHLNGPTIAKPAGSLSRDQIVDFLKLPAYEKTEWHALYGDVQANGTIKWKSFDELNNGPANHKQCIVFAKAK